MPKLPNGRLAELREQTRLTAQPATHLERWFANQAAYAAWELERVRANHNNTDKEQQLNQAYNRAARNWNRARKELETLQSARISRATSLTKLQQQAANAAPLAGTSKTKPAQSSLAMQQEMHRAHVELLANDYEMNREGR